MRCNVLVETLTDGTIVEEQTIAERLTRAAIRAYRMYPFTDVDAAVVAEVAGVPVDVVTRAFPSWDALLLVTYDYWTQLRGSTRRRKPSCAVDHVRMTLAEDIADPGLVRVLAGVINIAGADTSFAELFRKRYEDYVTQLAVALRRDFDAGVEASVVPAERARHPAPRAVRGLPDPAPGPTRTRRAHGVGRGRPWPACGVAHAASDPGVGHRLRADVADPARLSSPGHAGTDRRPGACQHRAFRPSPGRVPTRATRPSPRPSGRRLPPAPTRAGVPPQAGRRARR